MTQPDSTEVLISRAEYEWLNQVAQTARVLATAEVPTQTMRDNLKLALRREPKEAIRHGRVD